MQFLAILHKFPTTSLPHSENCKFAEFSKWGWLVEGEGQFGQNCQKLHENYIIIIFWAKQWGDMGGGKAIFQVVGGYSSPLQLGETLTFEIL